MNISCDLSILTHRDTKRGLGAATGVVKVAGAIKVAVCRLLPLLALLLLLLPAAGVETPLPLGAFAPAVT